MGTSQSTNQLSYYGLTTHPIIGQVQAYAIKNEAAKFVMKTKMKVCQQQLNLFQNIEKQKHQSIIRYYGTEVNSSVKQYIQIKGKKQIILYWELLNFDLSKQISHLKQKQQNIDEQILWEIIDNILKASKFFKGFNIYLDFRPNKIQFSAGKEPKIYWADILPNNMHRGFERFLHFQQFRHTVYAPQQLLQMKREQYVSQFRNRKQLNKQKCVMFNLGIILLQASSKMDVKNKIYNFSQKTFSQVKKRQIMDTIENIYSKDFWEVLCGLLQYFPNDRFNFKDLQHKINKHYDRKIEQPLFIHAIQNEQKQQQKTQKSSSNSKRMTTTL